MFFSEFGTVFKIFSLQHIIPIFFIIIFSFVIFIFKYHLKRHIVKIKILIIFLIILLYTLYYLWLIKYGYFNYKVSLPFELCDLMLLSIIPLFITKNIYLFEIIYFLGIGGSLYAILTPVLYYGFPHYIYFFFFISHCLNIISPLIMISVYNLKVSCVSILRVFVVLNIIGIIVYFIDILLDANYMFLREKPTSITLFNFIGDWPFYLFFSEIIALITLTILYLAFWGYNNLKIKSS